MIEKTTAYKVGEQFFPTIEAAQRQELAEIVDATAAGLIMEHKQKVLDILTMTPSSHPKGRAINGATRKRKAKAPAAAAATPPDNP